MQQRRRRPRGRPLSRTIGIIVVAALAASTPGDPQCTDYRHAALHEMTAIAGSGS
jgi:hypothetical protein